eukprot:TRINITY_DN66022_c1_g1_i1.p1 TRINITY_DN66022_c1_g1~~TRINITY_DN66022_c1_g1_i1.p1  ORF type:complete len:149 (+),score=23.00 TRINITY_DN66022_c1_g1_i1:75-521(+)
MSLKNVEDHIYESLYPEGSFYMLFNSRDELRAACDAIKEMSPIFAAEHLTLSQSSFNSSGTFMLAVGSSLAVTANNNNNKAQHEGCINVCFNRLMELGVLLPTKALCSHAVNDTALFYNGATIEDFQLASHVAKEIGKKSSKSSHQPK